MLTLYTAIKLIHFLSLEQTEGTVPFIHEDTYIGHGHHRMGTAEFYYPSVGYKVRGRELQYRAEGHVLLPDY